MSRDKRRGFPCFVLLNERNTVKRGIEFGNDRSPRGGGGRMPVLSDPIDRFESSADEGNLIQRHVLPGYFNLLTVKLTVVSTI